MEMQSMPTSSSRILYDVPCVVCRDHSSGKHYGVFSCDGCAGFFKRSVRRGRKYACIARTPGTCLVDKMHRNQCRACRMAKCLDAGMNRDAVQDERGPRNSTIRRQMALFLKDPTIPVPEIGLPIPPALDLALPKQRLMPPPPPMGLFSGSYPYRLNMLSSLLAPGSLEVSTPPTLTPMLMSAEPEVICEAAARLLFMNVKWAKNVPAFNSLSLSDRLLLLEESWRDLFVIGSAQFLYPINLTVLLNEKKKLKPEDVQAFEKVLADVASIRPDSHEYACLRAIVLFKTSCGEKSGRNSPNQGACKDLQDLPTVAALQDHSQAVLNEYTNRTYPLEPVRASRLVQAAVAARTVPGDTIVELFFRATIGDIPIERIIDDMYRSSQDA